MVDMVENENARLNVTISGFNGSLPDTVHFDSTDADIKAWAAEAIQNGDVPGIPSQENADFTDFVVDRFNATDEQEAKLFLRPKTPFGQVSEIIR